MKEKNKRKQKTITRHYLETLSVSLLTMVLLSIMLISKDRQAYTADFVNRESSSLANSTMTYYSYLVSVILREDWLKFNDYIGQIKREENLLAAEFVPPGDRATSALKKCYSYTSGKMEIGSIPTCHFLEGNRVWIIQEFTSGSRTLGYFMKSRSLSLVSNLQYAIQRPLLLLWLVFVLVFGIYYMGQLHRHVVKPLTFLSRKAKKLKLDEVKDYALFEVNHLAHALAQSHQELIAQSKLAAAGQMATQVAHDIRSPLSSMKAAMEYFRDVKFSDPKAMDFLNLLELSSKRLQGIANGLLKKHPGDEVQWVIFSLHQVLDELIGELQGQEVYRRVTFQKEYHSQAIELYGERSKLQRAFGNIIKNGVEAMGFAGFMTIRTVSENNSTTISICDNGPGMSASKLERVLAGGVTEGKEGGHGIGLTVVRETVKEFGGSLRAQSQEGRGTTLFIELPLPSLENLKSSPREEAAMEKFDLTVFEKEPVIVIDDDPSLREQWRLVLRDFGMGVILCDSWEDFEKQKISSRTSKTAVVDYHFDNSELNGAGIVVRLQEKGFTNLYLCTAEYWKPSVQKLAKELDVAVCPKPLPKISVRHDKPGGYTVLVIDDDETIRLAWELMDRKLQIQKLHTFANLEAMEGASIDLAALDIAFVDKNIDGSQFTGAQVVAYLKTKGVPKVILASGENSDELQRNPEFAQADFIVSEKIPQSFKMFFS